MKNKILLPFIACLALGIVSCKKSKDPGVIGKWSSISNYTAENGNFAWRSTSRFSQTIAFNPDARFNTFIDVPTGGGTYSYDTRAAEIDLSFEADHYGTVAGTITYKIEELTDNRLVVSSYSSFGNLQFKTEYIRLD
jgi:hypothetical protein